MTIDAMGCNPSIARNILDAGADYLLAVKDNQPTLRAEIERYFDTAPAQEVQVFQDIDKGHGRLEIRACRVSNTIDWLKPDRALPGAFRFPEVAAIAVIDTRVEHKGKIAIARRSYITSRPLSAQALAQAVRAHWGIENKPHWILDVDFGEDRSRLTGHGAHNMAIVRHFAINLVRTLADKISIKSRRKCASWDTNYLLSILSKSTVNLDS